MKVTEMIAIIGVSFHARLALPSSLRGCTRGVWHAVSRRAAGPPPPRAGASDQLHSLRRRPGAHDEALSLVPPCVLCLEESCDEEEVAEGRQS